MEIAAYPPQEPVPEALRYVHATLMELGAGVIGHEHGFGPEPSQSLIVYPAKEPGGPVLLFMHGGGWTNGYKEEMAFLAPAFNAVGISFVSSSYRLAPGHVFPANFEDAAQAVATVWALSDRYGFNRNAMFVGGHSAGGHLAALLATRSDWQGARSLPRDVVKGCAPISATYDFTPGCGSAVRPRFLGPIEADNAVPASPLFWVDGDAPPFLVAHASDDFGHLKVQSEQFVMVARGKGVDVQALEIPQTTHVSILLTAASDGGAWREAATKWIGRLAGSLQQQEARALQRDPMPGE